MLFLLAWKLGELSSLSSDIKYVNLHVLVMAQGVKYHPGDILTLIPRQNPDDVEAFLQRLSLDGDSCVTVNNVHVDPTLMDLLKYSSMKASNL